jgi:SAM-dependent methyltransferase
MFKPLDCIMSTIFYKTLKRKIKNFWLAPVDTVTWRARAWHARGKRLIKQSAISTFVQQLAGQPVRYKAFSTLGSGDFDQYVEERIKNPTKLCALDWLTRERLLDQTFTVLDVGCGPGVMARMIANHPTLKDRVVYTGIDQSENALSYARLISSRSYQFIHRDVLTEGLPDAHFDVIMLNEVVEHMPDYEAIIDRSIVKNPKVLILTAFAIEPLANQDRVRWNVESECYMNCYAFHRVHKKLRGIAANRPLYIADFGTSESSVNPWFSRKTHTVFYLPLAAPVLIEKAVAYAPYVINEKDQERFWGETFRAAK